MDALEFFQPHSNWASPGSADFHRAAGKSRLALGMTVSRFLVQFLAIATAARIIGPEEFGKAALVTIFLGFSDLLRDSGAYYLILQRANISRTALRHLASLNTKIGWFLLAACLSSSPFVVFATGTPDYFLLLTLASLSFPLNAIASAPTAILQKNFEVRALSIIDLASASVSASICVALSVNHAGAAAVVAQTVVFVALRAAFVSAVCPIVFFDVRKKNTKISAVTKAAYWQVSWLKIFPFLAGNSDSAIAGMRFGHAGLGMYAQAFQLSAIPTTLVAGGLQPNAVTVFYKTKCISKQKDAYALYFGQVSGVLWPLATFLAIVASPLVTVVYGSQWSQVGEILLCLLGVSFAAPFGYLNNALMRATRSTRANFLWSVQSYLVSVSFYIVGSSFSINYLALAFSCAAIFNATIGTCLVFGFGSSQFIFVVRLLLKVAIPTLCFGLMAQVALIALSLAGTCWVFLVLPCSFLAAILLCLCFKQTRSHYSWLTRSIVSK